MDKKVYLQEIGMQFKLERIRQRLTQNQLAEKSKLNPRTISVIEQGVESSRVHILKRVAEALEKPLSQFV